MISATLAPVAPTLNTEAGSVNRWSTAVTKARAFTAQFPVFDKGLLLLGAAFGLGFLAKYAMGYWLISALILVLAFRDERRHAKSLLGASVLALLIYAPKGLASLGDLIPRSQQS